MISSADVFCLYQTRKVMTLSTHSRLAPASSPILHFHNPNADPCTPYDVELQTVLDQHGFNDAKEVIGQLPWYNPTPLRELKGLAEAIGVERIYLKDESSRFGLKALKGVGGSYAIYRLLACRLQDITAASKISVRDILSGGYANAIESITVACATTGNHGRSVAFAAKSFGCRCNIYVPLNTSPGRVTALQQLGANVVRIEGNYDLAVKAVEADAQENGWYIISDTSYEGHEDTPRDVMHGYQVIADEIVEQLPADTIPTHVFVQAGVGGIAAAMCSHFWQKWGSRRPRFIVVESKEANCLYRSVESGKLVIVDGAHNTKMYGLAAGKPSLNALKILRKGADDFLAIDDIESFEAMRRLANPEGNDPGLVIGEAGGAGAGALIAIMGEREELLRSKLELTNQSIVLLFGTEGDTDSNSYASIVGQAANL
ncbi:diaminopropionate ammonia-lyase [Sphingosinicella rhizophila]|uniref:Diaminopropionate ammonia-lyase n=1 Tax=Sphingosinicella rhizophila TaxID=3050082 RepID=A0ABU3Q5L3_9SPHN|nr:diaminopropionate ammonia-lyase [Sphingosinicella sp. GR2756]MDT9598702.1 diaminopropionate ammonia-lyase [Sphingosinicella sp. GR2756]